MEGWRRWWRLTDGNESDSGGHGEAKIMTERSGGGRIFRGCRRGQGRIVDRNCQKLRSRICEREREGKSHEETPACFRINRFVMVQAEIWQRVQEGIRGKPSLPHLCSEVYW